MLGPYLAVALGGAIGAVSRYVTVIFVQTLWGARFPYATFIVNTLGSFLAGFFIALLVGRYSGEEYWRLFLFTGFLGAYTTFSSFSVETLILFEHKQWIKLCLNVVLNNVGSLSMALIGALIARYFIVDHLTST